MMEPSEKSFPPGNGDDSGAENDRLGSASALSAMRGDHLNGVALGQIVIQAVAVIGSVADQSCRERVEEAVPEDAFDELALVRRSALDTNGERKTLIIGESNGCADQVNCGDKIF